MKFTRRILTLGALAALLAPLAPATVLAATAKAADTTTTPISTSDSTRLTTIKTKGDAEIGRRLNTLNQLLVNISDAAKLSAANKQALSQEIGDETTNLMQLRLKLAGETKVTDAAADVAAMVTEYRVYALIVPKVKLVKAADDQQAVEQKFSDLQTKLAARITSAQNSGKDVSALQSKLQDLQTNVAAAQTLSSGVETGVLPLQPTDYDHDHSVLSGYRDKLQTARIDLQNAYNDAKAIIASLKKL